MLPPEGFFAPGIEEFFFDPYTWGPFGALEGTPFEVNRIVLMMLFMTGALCLLFGLGFRRAQVVPRGLQNVLESMTEFIRVQVAEDVMGKAGAKRFAPYLTALFFFVLAFNITSVLPPFHLPINGVIAVPLILSVITWVMFNYAGIKAQGAGGYLKGSLFPPGLPPFLYVLVTPIELVSTFILRPFTLTVRLLANMLAGHLILALFFYATTYLLLGPFQADGSPWYTAIFGVGALGAGVAFTFFEVLVAFLQAYIFTLLTAVYLAGSLEAHH
ncbi:MAG TPA: F0F1 ATP synthase subunit A [Mycobacteriales bacterium]|nr:F0F1 ATP synthase subunit A [Mycobacteriales bacterium]